jgi:hypothetical protein
MWEIIGIGGIIVFFILACTGSEKVENTDKKTKPPQTP